MNLHQVAVGAISAVNPMVPVVVKVATGYATNAAGVQVPTYASPQTKSGQVQPLTWRDLQQMEGLNLQGTRVGIYVNGQVEGIVRVTNRGGDIITIADGPRAGTYLCAMVLEQWPDWVKFAATLQDGS